MNRSGIRHCKVGNKTFGGAQGAITVRARTSSDAKRITAEITRTDPDDVFDACSVDETNERRHGVVFGADTPSSGI